MRSGSDRGVDARRREYSRISLSIWGRVAKGRILASSGGEWQTRIVEGSVERWDIRGGIGLTFKLWAGHTMDQSGKISKS